MTAYIIDTETSQQAEPEVIELAYCATFFEERSIRHDAILRERYKPAKAISCGARAVHHILDWELVDCKSSQYVRLPQDTTYVVGHNVDFDADLLNVSPKVRRICTLALARKFAPHVEGHTLSAWMYRISEDHVSTRARLRSAHDAAVDVELCFDLLEYFLHHNLKHVTTWEQLWQVSEDARIPEMWAFGKHKGKMIAETDRGYLNWCLKQQDMDKYVKEACRRVLEV